MLCILCRGLGVCVCVCGVVVMTVGLGGEGEYVCVYETDGQTGARINSILCTWAAAAERPLLLT